MERKRITKIYEKQRNEEMFRWFHEYALEFLRMRYEGDGKITYRENDDGIDVTLLVKEILILPDFDKELLEILGRSGTCSVKKKEDGLLEVNLWFRGWIWVKEDGTVRGWE